MILSGTCIDLARIRSALEELLSWRFWRRRPRLAVCAAYLALALGLAAAQIGVVHAERQRFLYYPASWLFRSALARRAETTDTLIEEGQSEFVGGGSLGVLPLDIKLYRIREGDTLSGIAERLAMDLDTIASLNREWGKGVHLIQIGEVIRVPNQDGIFIEMDGEFEALCEEKSVPAEVVLAVNQIGRQQVQTGMQLFFPGVQHTGIERSVITGTAFLRPLAGYLTSGFGYRRDPFSKEMSFHRGLDLAAAAGTSIRAALDGKVVAIGLDAVLGNYILIRHQIGYSSLYGHLQHILVERGDIVTRGQRIGTVGSTGQSTGPHLHFEIRKNGVPMNAWGLMTSR